MPYLDVGRKAMKMMSSKVRNRAGSTIKDAHLKNKDKSTARVAAPVQQGKKKK